MMKHKIWLKRRIKQTILWKTLCRNLRRAAWQFAFLWKGEKTGLDAEDAKRRLTKLRPRPEGEEEPARQSYEGASLRLSVIIPVYNTKAYLRPCIESVLCQQVDFPMEIILVNDGSTDGSEKELERYAGYPQVVIVQKKNGGLSSARNAGLQLARGEYVLFLDSDDYLNPGILEKLMKLAGERGCDIVQMGYEELVGERKIPFRLKLPFTITTSYGEMRRIPGHACMKLYRASLFAGVSFPSGYWFEDTIVHLILFCRARRIGVCPEPGYVYRKNPEGITARKDGNIRALDSLWVVFYILKERERLGMEMNPEVYSELLYHLSDILYHRIRRLEKPIQEAAFVLAAELVKQSGGSGAYTKGLGKRERFLERVFFERDFGLWIKCGKCGVYEG